MNFPSKCPYCGKDNVENKKNSVTQNIGMVIGRGYKSYSLESHQCVHCKSYIFLIKEVFGSGDTIKESKIINCYPTVITVDFPKRIKELSPTAYKTYEQTIKAKEQGFDMLVGAGLRIALEWLVWDYLVKVKDCHESDLEKSTLAKRIEQMSCDFYTEVCSRLVRLFGNDSVHIIKQIDFSVDEVIAVFGMLCSLIDSELQIKEVNERLPKKH